MRQMSIKLDESYYRDFIEKTAFMIFIADENGRLLHVNEAWRNALGYNDESDKAQLLWHYIHPYSRTHCKEHFRDVKVGDRFELELLFAHKEDACVYTEGKFNCTYDKEGQIKIITGILQDVTDKNLHEIESSNMKQHHEQMSKYWSLLNKIYLDLNDESALNFDENMVQALSAFGKEVYADRAFIIMYDFKEMTVTNTHEWCSGHIPSKKQNIQRVLVNFDDDWYRLHAAGEPVFIEDVAKLRKDDGIRNLAEPHGIKSLIAFPLIKDGKCYGCVGFDSVTVHRTNADTEKWILGELSVIVLNAILRRKAYLEMTSRVSNIYQYLESAPYGFFTIDGDGNFSEVNKTLCNQLGYSKEKLLKQTVKSIFCVRGQASNCWFFDEMRISESKKGYIKGRMQNGELKTLSINCSKELPDETFCYCIETDVMDSHHDSFVDGTYIAQDI